MLLMHVLKLQVSMFWLGLIRKAAYMEPLATTQTPIFFKVSHMIRRGDLEFSKTLVWYENCKQKQKQSCLVRFVPSRLIYDSLSCYVGQQFLLQSDDFNTISNTCSGHSKSESRRTKDYLIFICADFFICAENVKLVLKVLCHANEHIAR